MQNTNRTNFLLAEHNISTALTEIASIISVLLEIVLFAWGSTTLGHEQIEYTMDLLEVTNALVQIINLAQKNTSIVVNSPLAPGSINLISASIKADQLDAQKWQSWTMDPAQPDGARTQRLYRLISNLRSETDLYSIANFQIPYSPVRVCSAAQG